ncbi:hypothetical protein LTR91_009659 [Friedmanniomyces endolithicus]|uniref:Vacuolar membrane PQ loop repeat protein n=1 Tax=Friedmanniomyces endolithicus TaxID=329885 RepID=A0AAN6KL28_9PEZI|nr:hypothetical protein LTR35_006767 [Friedmanniomyces endolithicus]KAK0296970.1 hypothetical protein LTS00_004249 [Friedmanniomyces endolithicus]KAK0315051.1 hypothetical protein LTR82_012832 [Friedmanniomyces endolithicus]KAK0907337.1 hypothetical protein LTR57_017364 [Friedmanniomyces endolithicus]KAK0983689.1 hypothetical protein LTS01_010956 [Friedmanniomyces endolithicus]
MSPDTIPLTLNEALSGISGSISLAAWIFLLVPQLLENYQQGSADGISLTFLFIWFIGDVTNLAGALWAGLVPTVIALALYFCFADAILIGQCLYYNAVNKRREKQEEEGKSRNGHPGSAPREETPLLNGTADTTTSKSTRQHSLTDVRPDNLGLPGSRRRSSATSNKSHPRRRTNSSNSGTLAPILEENKPTRTRAYLKNTLSVVMILVVGTAGWAIAYRVGAWTPTPTGPTGDRDGEVGINAHSTPIGASILGYISAIAYLGARIPQILQNQRSRSCAGLSLLFFMLSLLGNATYGAGILLHSLEKEYVVLNLPWLIGSLGTMVEDGVIFGQFSVFGEGEEGGKEGEAREEEGRESAVV